ncbi:MAG TPA: cobyric acid synthase CobQ, partial [Ideonella sp.]|nr:cobyric acid synthase CobQ [Ideonella sp.]
MTPRAIMVWGCSSGAGKSLLATALCRWAARRGIDVAPFKAQNMSNNARVVAGTHGRFGEIGAAQYFQALAARVDPTVDMNPVLLKPECDTASQVVLHGKVAPGLSRLPWRERSAQLAQAARESFARLHAQHELLVIEGAGSPAEINLAACDYVNLDTARWARDAGPLRSLLVADID